MLDQLDGGAGNDTLNYSDASGTPTNLNALGLSLTSIENVNVRSTKGASADTTGFTGVENLNVTQGTSATVNAGSTTNVTVSGISGAIGIDGGKNVAVVDATKDGDITIGGTTVNAGTITVTNTNVGAADIEVDGGTSVTITATTATDSTGQVINVGQGKAATDLPSGDVIVTSNHSGTAATDIALSCRMQKSAGT